MNKKNIALVTGASSGIGEALSRELVKRGLYSIEDQCARIMVICEAAKHAAIPIFINARTDLFFKTEAANHNNELLEEALV